MIAFINVPTGPMGTDVSARPWRSERSSFVITVDAFHRAKEIRTTLRKRHMIHPRMSGRIAGGGTARNETPEALTP